MRSPNEKQSGQSPFRPTLLAECLYVFSVFAGVIGSMGTCVGLFGAVAGGSLESGILLMLSLIVCLLTGFYIIFHHAREKYATRHEQQHQTRTQRSNMKTAALQQKLNDLKTDLKNKKGHMVKFSPTGPVGLPIIESIVATLEELEQRVDNLERQGPTLLH